MIVLLSGVSILFGLTILLGVFNVFSGWQLTMNGLLGETQGFDGGVLLFVLGLFLLTNGISLIVVAGQRMNMRSKICKKSNLKWLE